MPNRLATLLGMLALCTLTSAQSQQFPGWEWLLHYFGGKTDETSVPSMKMGHMQMSQKAAAQPGDAERAEKIVDAARRVIVRYADERTALHDGYKPFHPTGKMGEEVHYTSYRYGVLERRHVNYDQPGSILYQRTPNGMVAVGVMYTAPQNATPEQLNAVAPLSVATWHRHIDFCGGPRNLPIQDQFGPHAQFGPQGSIHTKEACEEAHGLWMAVVFGWMTHVYPNAKDPSAIWAGMEMHLDANTDNRELR